MSIKVILLLISEMVRRIEAALRVTPVGTSLLLQSVFFCMFIYELIRSVVSDADHSRDHGLSF